MNIAIVSIVIFCIVSPAIIARRIYNSRELSNAYTENNTLQEILSSFFVAILLHILWTQLAFLLGYKIDFELIIKLLFNSSSITNYSNFTNNTGRITMYFLSLIFVASLSSSLLRIMVRKYKLDRKYDFLRYDNQWYYLLSGEVIDIDKYDTTLFTSDSINQRVVDVLTKKDTLYSGNVVDFQLDKNNKLDYVVISEPCKRTSDGGFQEINSNYFIIPYSDIQNINIRYYSTSEE